MGTESATVNFSELVNKNKQTLARLQESPRLLLHRRDGEDLVLTTAARAEQDQTVVSAATRMLAAMARREPGSMELLLDILSDAFPWVRFLPEPDLHAFAVELVDTMRAADSIGNTASVAQLLIAWQHTAEVYSDPELLAALTRHHLACRAGCPVLQGRGECPFPCSGAGEGRIAVGAIGCLGRDGGEVGLEPFVVPAG